MMFIMTLRAIIGEVAWLVITASPPTNQNKHYLVKQRFISSTFENQIQTLFIESSFKGAKSSPYKCVSKKVPPKIKKCRIYHS